MLPRRLQYPELGTLLCWVAQNDPSADLRARAAEAISGSSLIPAPESPPAGQPFVLPVPPPEDGDIPVAPPSPAKMAWADLLRRVFFVDPEQCRCGGRFRFIAVIEEPTAIEAVAAAIIASGHLPRHRAPRGPPAHPRAPKRAANVGPPAAGTPHRPKALRAKRP